MATSGGPRREPEEGSCDMFKEETEECPSTPKTLTSQEMSLTLSLKGPSDNAFRRGLSDEGLPLSPEVCTPRGDLMADIKKLEKRLESVIGVLAKLSNLTEGTRIEQQYLSERFEEIKLEHTDSKLRYIELARMVERLEDRLKMEKEKQFKKIDSKMAEAVEVRVKEEMDKRKSEYLAEIESKVKAMLMETQLKNEEREMHLHVRQQRMTEIMADQRVAEVKVAMLEAHKERDEVKKKFEVTLVKLRGEQVKNAQLMQRIQELELRCRHLEEENAHLRLSDIVHQTNFTFEGPMLECFSCRQEYSTHQNDARGCRYHPIPCMPHETWRNCISKEELPSGFTMSQRYHYWACCNVLASRRPEGCCHGRHHQQWEMDIMMRQVLVEGSEHSAFTEPLRVQ